MPRRTVFWAIALCAVAFAAVQAWSLRWTCDDAYISFRYAANLAEHGELAFNVVPLERVEGYTNFGWVVLLAAGASPFSRCFATFPEDVWGSSR